MRYKAYVFLFQMSRKLMCLMWFMVLFTVGYVILTILSNTKDGGRKILYMNGLDSFYRDIGMKGLDRNSLIRQSFKVQRSFEEMLSGESIERDMVYANTETEGGEIPEPPGSLLKPDVHLNISTKLDSNSTEKRKSALVAAETKLEKNYYRLRKSRVNPFDFKFIKSSENICANLNKSPYLVIMCLSKYYDIETREAIRHTWGSVANLRRWPNVQNAISDVKLVFLLGSHENSLVKKAIIEDETRRFGDIVAADFIDSYTNLTYKVLMGLKWVSDFCPTTKFVVKVDQDTFLHVANLLHFLFKLQVPDNGIIIGYKNVAPKVLRSGKWGISRAIFPLPIYPNYTNGNCYVISGNIVPSILEAAEQLPYISVEDVFITGE